MKHVLVAGAGGYIGAILIKRLLANGFAVTGLDRFFFGKGLFNDLDCRADFYFCQKDIRDVTSADLGNIDIVIDMAGLSNDPSCDLDATLTKNINYLGAIHLYNAAKEALVERYIYSSSCSVYGSGAGQLLDEESALLPVSEYAKTKIKVENYLLQEAQSDTAVTLLRNATAYGLSPRMRFDLFVNTMTLTAWRDQKLFIRGGGRQWRPLIHVQDIAKAIVDIINAPQHKISGQIFNVGSSSQNYQVRQLAYMIKDLLPSIQIIETSPDVDQRNYRVCFDKIKRSVGFSADFCPIDGVQEILSVLASGEVEPDNLKHFTVNYYKYLMEAERIVREYGRGGAIF